MKGYHSNSKLVFAYQDTEARAATHNLALDPNADNQTVIRVISPKYDPGQSLQTHHNYVSSGGTGWEQYASDSLVGVAVSRIVTQAANGATSYASVNNPVKSITRVQEGGITGELFDIQLSAALEDSISSNGLLLHKAVIELYFSSGDTEDLILNLKQPSKCTLIIHPGDVRLGGQFAVTNASNQSLDTSVVAYSVSKAYRSLIERANASTNTTANSRNLYCIGYNGYTPFSAPFGVIYDDVKSLPLALQPNSGLPTTPYINGGDGFASSLTSHLTWFTGRSDMSRLRILPTASPLSNVDSQEQSLQNLGGVDLSPFFFRSAHLRDYNIETEPEESQPYIQNCVLESPSWGQSFGWLSTFVKGDIVKGTDEATVVSEIEQNFGVPPIFREGDQRANQPTLGVDRPTNFWGAFQDGPQPNDGSFFANNFGTINSGSNDPLTTDPCEVRYSRLLFGANGKVPNTNMPTALITGQTDGLTSPLHTILSNYDITTTRTYFCFYPNGVTNTASGMRLGSVGLLQTNPGANFFYPGCAGTAADPYVPVFKGIARVSTVTRYGQYESTLGGLVRRIINKAQTGFANTDFNSLDLSAIWLGSLGVQEGGNTGVNRFNNVDLLMNLLFSGHTYPAQPTGLLSSQQSKHLPGFSNSSGMMFLYAIAHEALRNEAALDPTGAPGLALGAQDIVFLNSAYAPDAVNIKEPVAAPDPYIAISKNHPIGHALSGKGNSSILVPDYEHLSNADYSSFGRPFAFTSKTIHAEFGENAANQIPPYPYSIGSYLTTTQKGSWKNYAAPTSGNATSKSYFNEDVSENSNGVTIRQADNVTVPAAVEQIATMVKSGATAEPSCFSIIKSTVKLIGAGSADLTSSVLQNNTEPQIEFKMNYVNSCASGFEKSDSTKITTGATLAARVAEVLEIFPHIEYRPLAMLSAQPEQNPFAYKVIVQDENDVDDISIVQNSDSTYTLTIIMTAAESDIIEVDGVDQPVPYGDVWGDIPYPTTISTEFFQSPVFSQRYISVEGEQEYSGFKSSFITIASSDTWDTFTMDAFAATGGDNGTANNYHADTVDYQLAYHHPFIAFNKSISQDDVTLNVFGCTDSTADNYDPNANVDDGSCESCQTIATEGTWDISVNGLGLFGAGGGIRPGVYQGPNNTPGAYVYGAIGGNQNQLNIAGIQSNNFYFTSAAASYGGAIALNNDYAGEAANGYLSIKGGLIGQGLQEIISYLVSQGEDHTMWNLKIKAITDTLIAADLNFSSGYNAANPVPSILTNAPALYNSQATGGTAQEPTWDDIVTPTTPLAGIVAGVPYILELQLIPKSISLLCTAFNDSNNVILGIMWTSFCSCSNTTNDYFFTAMNGATYPWQQTGASSFPILNYNSGNCPDSVDPNILNGDSPYPQNICFTADAALSDCDQYWLWCIADFQLTCASTVDTLDDGYQVGDTYFFDYVDGYIQVHVEGVYNSTTDSFIWDPNIEYNIVVTGPNYASSQNQTDNIASPTDNIFINQFNSIVAPGEYTVTITFLSPYDAYFNDPQFPNNQCEFTDTIIVVEPSEICDQIIEGCTDPTADNYDENATVDNGTCENSDPCSDTILNPSFSVTPTATPSTSLCLTDTITIEGIQYTSTVIVPVNDGSISTSITYTAGLSTTGVNNFALLVLNEQSVINGIDTVIDSVATMFTAGNIPTNTIDGVTIDGIGYWSPLFTVTTTATFTYPLTGLSPGNYYVIAIANPSASSLVDCGEGAFAQLLEYLTLVNVGLNDPAVPCPEPCIGPLCDDYVLGCTDPGAENYSPDATYDDGSCSYTETFCEQNPSSSLCNDCTGLVDSNPAPRFTSGTLDETICDEVNGSDGFCTDPNACNYNPDAPLDLSNNLICDYCSCVDPDDPDCFQDNECDPDLDPNCAGPDPECPDPSNPDCNPDIYDPCPTGTCGPPIDPCIILGNCPEDGGGGGDDGDPFEDVVVPVEITCPPDIETADGSELNFNDVQLQAFQCMSQEGQKMLFRMKSGAYYDDTDILKLSLIAYLFAGGINKSQLPCLFNCNYESAEKSRAYSCKQNWAASGARFYNSTDSYQRGDIAVYYYLKGGKVTRNYYVATREIQPIDLHPRYPASGWHRCIDVSLRTKDGNNIATGEEEYLQVMWEFMTRFCNECEVTSIPQPQDVNNVDPKSMKNYLDPKTTRTNYSSNSGIIGENGDEIIF